MRHIYIEFKNGEKKTYWPKAVLMRPEEIVVDAEGNSITIRLKDIRRYLMVGQNGVIAEYCEASAVQSTVRADGFR